MRNSVKNKHRALPLLTISAMMLCIFNFSCLEPPSLAQLVLKYSDNTCAGDSIYEQGRASISSFDSAVVEVSIEDLEVTLDHKNAFLNCCLDSISSSLDQTADTVRLLEEERVTSPCDCICPFEVIAVVAVPEPGIYVFEIWTQHHLVWRKTLEIGS